MDSLEKVKDLARLAGFIDGEGTICISPRFRGGKTKKYPNGKVYGGIEVNFRVGNTNLIPMMEVKRILSWIFERDYPLRSFRAYHYRGKQFYTVSVNGFDKIEKLFTLLLPYLVGKKREAELVLRYIKERRTWGRDINWEIANQYIEQMKIYHNRHLPPVGTAESSETNTPDTSSPQGSEDRVRTAWKHAEGRE